ncbi:MAG: sedoheptulose 7-phosphate cyclase, partial [Rhodanobacter sp.]
APTRWHVSHQRAIEYDIISAPTLFDPNNSALLSCGRINSGRRFVVVDEQVAQHCASALDAYFTHHHIDTRIVRFPGGEVAKTMDAYLSILHELDAFPIHRRDEPIIAIGGGV